MKERINMTHIKLIRLKVKKKRAKFTIDKVATNFTFIR